MTIPILQQDDSSARRQSRRAAPRYILDNPVNCVVIDPHTGQARSAWISDISTMGIGLLLEGQFLPGKVLAIELACAPLEQRGLTATVRHSDILFPNDAWLHGCSLSPTLKPHDLEALTASRQSR